MTDRVDLDKLRELAEAATPGPWEAECDEGEGTTEVNAGSAFTQWTDHGGGISTGRPARSWRSTDRIIERDDLYDEDYEQAEADAEFIAAANPAVVLGLLDRLAWVEALHVPHTTWTDICNADKEFSPCATVRALTGEGRRE